MLDVIDWPGYGCPVRKYTNKKVCYRTRTSVQSPRATTPSVSRRADSRRARLFEGRQLIISVIARAQNFVIKYDTGKLPMHVRLSGSVELPYEDYWHVLCYRLHMNTLGARCDDAALYRCDIFLNLRHDDTSFQIPFSSLYPAN